MKAFLLDGSTLYVGGDFTHIGGKARKRIAALDKATGDATPWDPGAGARVCDIALDGSTVYVGGGFTSMGGATRDYAAAIDATTGADKGWNAKAGGPVYSILPSAGTVYLGGEFGSMGGKTRNNLAAVDAVTGDATAWNPNVYGISVGSMHISGQALYTGGEFIRMGGDPQLNSAQFGYPASVWYLAEGCTGGDFETWILVQSPNFDPVSVDLAFMTGSGPVPGPQDYRIAGNSRESFRANDYVTDFKVSTKVESEGGNIICERAMYGGSRTWAHDSIGY